MTILNKCLYYLIFKSLKRNPEHLKEFIRDEFYLQEDLPDRFYEILVKELVSHPKKYYEFFDYKDIYLLIGALQEKKCAGFMHLTITPTEFYSVPKRYVNKLLPLLDNLEEKNPESPLTKFNSEEPRWTLKYIPIMTVHEKEFLSHKLILCFGLENAIELLTGMYGTLTYEELHFLMYQLEPKRLSSKAKQVIKDYLFSDKKSPTNIMRLIISGKLNNLFLNFDYFYNNLDKFIKSLGTRLPIHKVEALIKNRYINMNTEHPTITGDISEDMIASYYCRYDFLSEQEQDILSKNYKVYDEHLKNKVSASIPYCVSEEDGYTFETLLLDDPRNLVMGYRAGNCFRLNGEASVLFNIFLKSPDMRIVSISTDEYKDFAMMLLMRNGNVLISQGIETSKRVPKELKGKKLFDASKKFMTHLMNEMNNQDDEIVATIIGATNENTFPFVDNELPYLIPPILPNQGNYYNGINSFQSLLALAPNKKSSDIKLYTPKSFYLDPREKIYHRHKYCLEKDASYEDFEKRMQHLRYLRMKQEGFEFMIHNISSSELSTICNSDWYITIYQDGSLDSYLSPTKDPRAKEEYEINLQKVLKKTSPKQ